MPNDAPRITDKQRRWLKKQAHHLRPVVMLGQHGLTDAVINEIEIALKHHELIKVKVNAGEREERDALVAAIAQRTASDLVQRIGNTASYFRANPKLSDPMRLPLD